MTQPAIASPSNARSRRTRTALLAAARDILETDGVGALTMGSVAERAGVTRGSVYLHFGSRAALIGALYDYLAQTEGLEESLNRVWAAPDSVTALDAWARHLADYHPRLLAVDRAFERVHRQDPDAADHRQRVAAGKLRSARRLARWLNRDGMLASEWKVTSAADMLYALISSDLFEALLADRRWSRARLAQHLAILFRNTFVSAN